jgi:hypothetical protein
VWGHTFAPSGLTVTVISCSGFSGTPIVDKREGFGFRVVISVSLFVCRGRNSGVLVGAGLRTCRLDDAISSTAAQPISATHHSLRRSGTIFWNTESSNSRSIMHTQRERKRC